jgi:nitroreductase/NAD-dependent dihydropyrimidine dehydrogenase PreA subunit
MPLFTIDADKCNRDGLCAAECPAGCIVFEPEQLPVPHKNKFAYCINCGHCIAVCPKDAIQLERFEVPAFRKEKSLNISPDQAVQFMKARRSVRSFRNEPLDRQVLEDLLDITQYAPSGHNARPVRWVVAATPEKVQGVAEATVNWMRTEVEAQTERAEFLHLAGIVRAWDKGTDMVCRHAPALAVAHAPSMGITPVEDGIIAVAHLELAVTGAGFGACWCGYVLMALKGDESLRRIMGIPEDNTVCGDLLLGKPVRRFSAIPPRPKAEVTWL